MIRQRMVDVCVLGYEMMLYIDSSPHQRYRNVTYRNLLYRLALCHYAKLGYDFRSFGGLWGLAFFVPWSFYMVILHGWHGCHGLVSPERGWSRWMTSHKKPMALTCWDLLAFFKHGASWPTSICWRFPSQVYPRHIGSHWYTSPMVLLYIILINPLVHLSIPTPEPARNQRMSHGFPMDFRWIPI